MSDMELVFPIKLREDLIIRIVGVPHNLTKQEAERIAKIIMAFAAPETPKGTE